MTQDQKHEKIPAADWKRGQFVYDREAVKAAILKGDAAEAVRLIKQAALVVPSD